MPDNFTFVKFCSTPECRSRIEGDETLTFYDGRGSDLIVRNADRITNAMDAQARAAGWRESLGDWYCDKCAGTTRYTAHKGLTGWAARSA